MQVSMFTGNLARAVALTGSGDRAVARFTLISNEYAGKDADTGVAKERSVSIQFTAFRGKAEALAKSAMKGDQIIVSYRIENNHYTKDGEDVYGYNFLVDAWEYGAPGKEKRDQFQAQPQSGAA